MARVRTRAKVESTGTARQRSRKRVKSEHPMPPRTLHDKKHDTWYGPKPEVYAHEKKHGQYYYCTLSVSDKDMQMHRTAAEKECSERGIPIEVYTWPSTTRTYRVDRKYADKLPPKTLNRWNDIPYGFPAGDYASPWLLSYVCAFPELMKSDGWVVLQPEKKTAAGRTRRRRK